MKKKTYDAKPKSNSKKFNKKIMTYEITGFVLVVFILWVDEFYDLPFYLFRAPKTPVN